MNRSMSRAWVEIDLGALLYNGTQVTERAEAPLLPMVKADAYGLGAVAVARALEALEPWGYGVATVGEGEELRRAGIARPILVFTPILAEELDHASRAQLTPVLSSRTTISRWSNMRLPWHLGIDTGMSRAGVPWHQVGALDDLLRAFPPSGACTHFHSAERDDPTRDEQTRRFEQALAALPARPPILHVENSPAVEHRAPSPWSFVRPGVFLYGVGSGGALEPAGVVSVRARIVDVRVIHPGETVSYDATWRAEGGERRIATIALGYADGLRRAASGRAQALVRGRRVPMVGLVTMDMTMLDVTGVDCAIGDVATVIGDDGAERITVSDAAQAAGLSPYEVLTSLRGRLPRCYVPGAGD